MARNEIDEQPEMALGHDQADDPDQEKCDLHNAQEKTTSKCGKGNRSSKLAASVELETSDDKKSGPVPGTPPRKATGP